MNWDAETDFLLHFFNVIIYMSGCTGSNYTLANLKKNIFIFIMYIMHIFFYRI